ncbi:hypothetical protein ATANTOWER_002283 [Ataeniobius toweri]|uniref:Uncharacterized protein n=1 Tax=Ataeniobius toweri TaxID=208326 RepID=A0ABU7A1J5_9TELE|nr:hypothetical protein [Ataeniobius toweri]
MDGNQAEVKEQSHSSEFSSASIESTGGTNKGDRCSDVRSPAEVKYDKDEYLMMPPEEKLKHFNCRAQVNEDDQEVGDSKQLST